MIKHCCKKDLDSRPAAKQKWCLYSSDGSKLLGRHPSHESALAQERAIQVHKHGAVAKTPRPKFQIGDKVIVTKDGTELAKNAMVSSVNEYKPAARQWTYVVRTQTHRATVTENQLAPVSNIKQAQAQESQPTMKKTALSAEEALKKVNQDLQSALSIMTPKEQQQAIALLNQQLAKAKSLLEQAAPAKLATTTLSTADRLARVVRLIEKRSAKTAARWSELPKGWTESSVKKFWDSLTGDVEHKVTKCMKEMKGKVSDPGAFCASCKRKAAKK